jgi:hypothetical protein
VTRLTSTSCSNPFSGCRTLQWLRPDLVCEVAYLIAVSAAESYASDDEPCDFKIGAEIRLASSKTQKRVTEAAVEQPAPHQSVEPQRLLQVLGFRGIRVPASRLH